MRKRIVAIVIANILVASLSIAQNSTFHTKILIKENNETDYIIFEEKVVSDSISVNIYLKKTINFFRAKHYIAAGYDSIVKDDNRIKAYLSLNEKYRWDELTFNIHDDSIICKKSLLKKKNRIRYISEQEDYINQLLTCYENNGYPFCSIHFDSISHENEKLKACIYIEKGDKILFDSIFIKGEVNVKSKFLYKYLNYNPNSVYSEAYIQKLITIISNSAFYNMSKMPELAFGESTCDITLYLTKKKSSNFSGIIGFLPDNRTTGRIVLTGDVNLLLENIIGRGENLSFNWLRYDAFSQQLQTSFYYPYIFNTKIGTQVGFELLKQDSSFLSVKTRIGMRYLFFANNGINVFYDNFSSFSLETRTTEQEEKYGKVKNPQIGIGLINSNLDNQTNPYRGFFINAEISSGLRQHISNNTTIKQFALKSGIDAKKFTPIANKLSLMNGVKFGFIHSKNLFENELFLLGGLKNIRGFDENSIHAKSFLFINTELRYLFEKNSALFLFFDYGLIENFSNTIKHPDNLFGFGAGLNMFTKAGIFSLVYALGSQQSNPIDIRASKIHFGYISKF